jgi:diguanylate cyclase (GGDEF)-like protein
MEQALIPIERIRKKIEKMEFDYKGTTIRVTVSCGLSEASKEVTSQEELILRADKSLYASKRDGRNRTTCFDSSCSSI